MAGFFYRGFDGKGVMTWTPSLVSSEDCQARIVGGEGLVQFLYPLHVDLCVEGWPFALIRILCVLDTRIQHVFKTILVNQKRLRMPR